MWSCYPLCYSRKHDIVPHWFVSLSALPVLSVNTWTASIYLYNILISVGFFCIRKRTSYSSNLFWVSTMSSKVSVSAAPIRARDFEEILSFSRSSTIPQFFVFLPSICILYLLPLPPSRLRQFTLTVYFACAFLYLFGSRSVFHFLLDHGYLLVSCHPMHSATRPSVKLNLLL